MKLFLTLAYFLTIHVQNKLFFKIKDNISYRVYVTYYGQFYRPLNLNGMTKSAVVVWIKPEKMATLTTPKKQTYIRNRWDGKLIQFKPSWSRHNTTDLLHLLVSDENMCTLTTFNLVLKLGMSTTLKLLLVLLL